MSTPQKSTESAAALRQRAEVAFRGTVATLPACPPPPLTLEAARTMLHELQVHQIELEMQNEELRQTQAQLEVSRASYFDFYNLAPVGYCTVSETGLILEANLPLATRLGVALVGAPDALLTQPFTHFIFKEDQDVFYFLRQRLLTSGQPQTCELRLGPPAGPHFWVQLAATAFPQADGATVLRLVLSDITDAKQAEAALRESHDLFAQFIQHSPIYAYIKTVTPTASRVLHASDSFQLLVRRSGAELVGQSMTEMFPADLAAQITADDWTVVARGEVVKRLEDFNGRHYATVKFPIVQGGRTLLGGYTVDITNRVQAEVALRESETKFRNEKSFNQLLLDTSPALIVGIGFDGKTLMMNQALLETLEYTAAEVRGTDYLTTFVPPEDRRLLAEIFQRVIQEKGTVVTTNRILSKSGQTYLVEWHGRKVADEAVDLGFFVGVGIDITARKLAEGALHERRKEMDCLYAITALGQAPHSLEEMFQGSVELLPTGWHYAEVAAARILWQGRAYQTSNFRETEWRQSRDLRLAGHPLGQIDLCYLEARPDLDEGPFLKEERDLMNAVAIKLERFAERLQVEALLTTSEDRYRTLFDRANDGITLISPEGELLELNESFAHMHGYPRAEMRWLKLADLDTPPTLAAVPERMRRLLAGEALTFEVEHYHKEGRVVSLEVSASLISVTGQPALLCFHRDITERKRTEAALRNSLQEKEALLKEVHHRVKNNLQLVASLLHLENRRSQQPDTKAVLTDMQSRIHSMALLHESLYHSGNFAAVDLGTYLRDVATQSFRMGAHRTGLVHLTLDLASVPIEMDQAVSCGLLLNELISNCLKHGFPAGRSGAVRIALQPVAGGPQVCLRVSDTGIGLPPDFAAQRGKSLGLQLVADLTGHLKGTLAIGPEPEAVFAVTFTPQAGQGPEQPR